MNKKLLLVTMLPVILLSGCYLTPQESPQSFETSGYRPVYGSPAQQEIELTNSQTVKNPGKIYAYKNFLLVNEINEGIHLFDNTNPENPEPIGFIQVLGNSDMAIKDEVLYADHMGNLVALVINDFKSLDKAGDLPLQNWNLGLPPPHGSYFECVDPSKGLVIQWKKVNLKDPDCYANN